MKKSVIFMITGILGLALLVAQGCSFSTANMSSLKTSKDKDGKTEASSFTTGDTLYANAEIANNPGKVKVKFALVAEDVKGLTKGDTLKGSEVTVDIEGDGKGQYSVPVSAGFLAGTYKLNADMLNDKGEKKDGKSANVTVTQKAPEPKKVDDEDADDDK
jgi:hypothetical protein